MAIPLKEAAAHVGQVVDVAGWCYNLRSSGSIMFLELRDGSGRIQAVLAKAAVPAEVWARAQTLTMESSVRVRGAVKAHPKKEGVFELDAVDVMPVAVAAEYPIGKK